MCTSLHRPGVPVHDEDLFVDIRTPTHHHGRDTGGVSVFEALGGATGGLPGSVGPGTGLRLDFTRSATSLMAVVGTARVTRTRAEAERRTRRTATGYANIGIAFLHTVVDDHSRLAYLGICPDERAAAAFAVLCRVVALFAEYGSPLNECSKDVAAAVVVVTEAATSVKNPTPTTGDKEGTCLCCGRRGL